MPAVLLDGSCVCGGRGEISQRSRRSARENSQRRPAAIHRAHSRIDRMNISAGLLAGGESRRMGKDKPTIVFHGKPLWQIQLDLLRKLYPAHIFLSARTDPGWRPRDVQFVK